MTDTVQPVTDPTTTPPRVLSDRVSAVIYPLLSFGILLILWQWGVRAAGVPEYILPVPSEFLAKLWAERPLIAEHSLATAHEIVLGFLAAAAISIPLGFVIVSVRLDRERGLSGHRVLPARAEDRDRAAVRRLVRVRAVPEGAAHLPALLLPDAGGEHDGLPGPGRTGALPHAVDGRHALETFRYVRVPAAMTYIFAGLKVSVVFAATGAIVGEFVGANTGLGYLLLRGTSFLDMPLIFAVLVALSASASCSAISSVG